MSDSSFVPKKIYRTQWDKFYAALGAESGKKALWDVAPELAVDRDMKVFGPFFDKNMPLVDFGCGTGAQAAFLHGVGYRVVGMDVSQAAIAHALDRYSEPGLSFVSIDEQDPEFFVGLHRSLGDMNIYMRGVLHQILDEDLASFVESLKILMGVTGKLYFVEVADSIRDYFKNGPDNFSRLPAIMQRTFISHLPPRGVSPDDIPRIFPETDFKLLKIEETELYTNLVFENDRPIHIPAIYGIVRR